MAPLCQINGFSQVLFIARGLCILKPLLKRVPCVFGLSSGAGRLRICIFTCTEVWELCGVAGTSRKTPFPSTVLKHCPCYPDHLSTEPMLRIAFKECLWVFPGTNVWSRVSGHLPNRTKLITPYGYLSYQSRTSTEEQFLILWRF